MGQLNLLHTHTHTHLTVLFPGLPGWAGARKVKPIWSLMKQETVSGSGISWAICKSAPCSRQITTPAPHHSVFLQAGCTRPVKKLSGVLAWLHVCVERGADLQTAQLMPLPLTVSCFSKIQIGSTFLVTAYPGSPGKRTVKWA